MLLLTTAIVTKKSREEILEWELEYTADLRSIYGRLRVIIGQFTDDLRSINGAFAILHRQFMA